MVAIAGILAKQGLSLLARVVKKKGADIIKQKTGIDLSKGEPTEAEIIELKRFEMENEVELQELALEGKKITADVEKYIQTQVTDRHSSDMKSDSWLSKNIRPLSLMVVLATVVSGLFAEVDEDKYETISKLCETCFMFYFGGRSVEKVTGGIVDRGKGLYDKIRGRA